jgi:hypothetical protein
MNIFSRRRLVRGLAGPIPPDANDNPVEEMYEAYPFKEERVGVRSFVRLIVWTVLEMKKRGLI